MGSLKNGKPWSKPGPQSTEERRMGNRTVWTEKVIIPILSESSEDLELAELELDLSEPQQSDKLVTWLDSPSQSETKSLIRFFCGYCRLEFQIEWAAYDIFPDSNGSYMLARAGVYVKCPVCAKSDYIGRLGEMRIAVKETELEKIPFTGKTGGRAINLD